MYINNILKEFQDIFKICSSGCLQFKCFSKCNQQKKFGDGWKAFKAKNTRV